MSDSDFAWLFILAALIVPVMFLALAHLARRKS